MVIIIGCEGTLNATSSNYAKIQNEAKNSSQKTNDEAVLGNENSTDLTVTGIAGDLELIAEQAYLYGLQQVIFYGQRWIYTQNNHKTNNSFVGINRLIHIRQQITPDFPVVTPNATTLYGSGFMDLQGGPVILEMPEINDRYFSAQVMDQYGIFHTMVGNRFNGSKAKKYIFIPPSYQGSIPREFSTQNVIQWPSNIAYVLVRIALETGSENELKQINAWQDSITLTPMKSWMANSHKGIERKNKSIVAGRYFVPENLPNIAKGQVDKQSAEDYFTLLNAVLNDPSMTLMNDSLKEAVLLNQLLDIGIGKGKSFNWQSLDENTRSSLRKGFNKGFNKVRESVKNNLINLNGWMEVRNSGRYEIKWLDRAIMADVGWAGPDRNVSHAGAFLFKDDQGQPLNGRHQYTLTFDMKNLPPVDEFWSIPIYNLDGYFVANDINRYTINSFMLKHNLLHIEDEQLIIYIQHEKPTDPKKLKNWLPAPKDDFRFTARFYHPRVAIVDGSYPMPKPKLIQ